MGNSSQSMSYPQILAIGYGNDLRGDDGIGVEIARIVARWNKPGVRSLAVHQLTPELAAEIAESQLVIFIDAYQASQAQNLQVCPIEPLHSDAFRSHNSDPQGLLTLTRIVFGRCPPAWLIAVPGVNFELGEQLSPIARQGLSQALRQIDLLLESAIVNYSLESHDVDG
ncbi:MAG: hydrogenase maturation protease [Hydrococcus sp. Prado102]|jgi:hydrogenase maturation protease|nr:hydrogenase maturation protease [Hydrococcus sp. Prado102]